MPERSSRRLTLPNGMDIACQTTTEAKFFYDDIFVKRIYHRNGISLDRVECVFDVGANIGLFSLFVRRYCPRAVVYAFEPVPPLFEILNENVAGHGGAVKTFNLGITDREGKAQITFYSESSGMSSFYADATEERLSLKAIFENQRSRGMAGIEALTEHSEDWLEERLRSERFTVAVAPLSKLIRDERVERIDLLKVDVQKAEADVLAGIEQADWPKVRQIVVEVHDIDGRLECLGDELSTRGFQVSAEQDDHYEGSRTYNLFAVRPRLLDATGVRPVRERAARLAAALHSGVEQNL